MKNVPEAQRAGLTVWNLTDDSSWIVLGGKMDYPMLFDANLNKKPAFSGLMMGLKGINPSEN